MTVLGLDPRINPAIRHPYQIANDAIPVNNHPMKMTGSSSGHNRASDRYVRYVNSKDGWHYRRGTGNDMAADTGLRR